MGQDKLNGSFLLELRYKPDSLSARNTVWSC